MELMVSQNLDGTRQPLEHGLGLRVFPRDLLLELQSLSKLPEEREALIVFCRKIRVHASFLGYPAIACLARKLEETLSYLPGQRTISAEHWKVVDAAFDQLAKTISMPKDNYVAEIDEHCSTLSRIFAATHDSEASIDNGLLAFEPPTDTSPWRSALASEISSTAGIGHQDLDIYHKELLDGMEKCSEEESWLVAQVASAAEDLAGRQSNQPPAKKLLSILGGHRFFQEVDRACIVGLVPGSNQLVVIDSAIHQRLRERGVENHMPPGYSCFISPTGSLTTLTPGFLRIFDDSSKVLDSFARAGRPAQRSIAYVAESGLKSGICLAIGRGQTVQGYMFLNSLKPGLFNHVMRDYAPILSLFTLIGTISLDAAGFSLSACQAVENEPISIPRHSSLFKATEFSKYVSQSLQLRTGYPSVIRVVMSTGLPFLYAPTAVVTAIAKLALGLGVSRVGTSGELVLTVSQRGEQILFEINAANESKGANNLARMERLIHEIQSTVRHQPLAIVLQSGKVTVGVPYEPVLDPGSTEYYSVAY
jgi:hypothetical protein